MAADKDEGARVLTQGLESALVDATNDKRRAVERRPAVGPAAPERVSLARMERFRDINELDRLHPRRRGADASVEVREPFV